MSYKTDFKTFINTWIKQNGQNLITGDLLNEALSPWLADRMVWSDEIGSSVFGFGATWTYSGSSLAEPPAGGFAKSSTEMWVNKTAVGINFDNTINSIKGISISDSDGNKLIFEVSSTIIETDYIKYTGVTKTGTLTALTVSDTYTLGFMYGAAEIKITDIYVVSETEFLAAVANINDNFVGGNIILGANITLTADRTVDLTNIDVYGFSHSVYNGGNDAGTDLGYTLTISAGSPTFYNTSFIGTVTGSKTIVMSTQSTRPLFDLGDIIASSRSIAFNKCSFLDVIGGAGAVDMIASGTIANYRSLSIFFDKCVVGSHNNDSAFLMSGVSVSNTTTTGNLVVNVINQLRPTDDLALTNSNLLYKITSSDSGNTLFNSDGSARMTATSTADEGKAINFSGVPTADTGVSGDVWNDAGTLKIVV